MSYNRTIPFLEQLVTAELVRAECFTLPIDLYSLARNLGVSSIAAKEMAAEGYVEATAENTFRIALRKDRSPQRTRFSLAHELGHIIMHRLSGGVDNTLARQYRAFTSVSSQMDDEAIADSIAGIILLPPWLLSQELPEDFSIRRIVRLASQAQCSVPVALIRSMWYTTQPSFAFHLRIYDGDARSLRCLWARGSRPLGAIDPESVTRLVSEDLLGQALSVAKKNNVPTAFATAFADEGWVSELQLFYRRFGDRDLVYGLAKCRESSWTEVEPLASACSY